MAKKSIVEKSKKEHKHSTRDFNVCQECGRTRGYMRKFKLCRICFREKATNGEIPGVQKASW